MSGCNGTWSLDHAYPKVTTYSVWITVASTFAIRIDFIGHKSRIRRTAHTTFWQFLVTMIVIIRMTLHDSGKHPLPLLYSRSTSTHGWCWFICTQRTFTHNAHARNVNVDGESNCSVNLTIQFLNETRLVGWLVSSTMSLDFSSSPTQRDKKKECTVLWVASKRI